MNLRKTTILSLIACSGTALAQFVTLYGVADMNLEYANHMGAVPVAANSFNRGPPNIVFRMNSGGLSGSRWGLRGTEDLGPWAATVGARTRTRPRW